MEQSEPCQLDAAALEPVFDVEVAADVAHITPLVERILVVVDRMGCAEGRELDIELAVREALANAIRHGCGGDSTKRIRCSVSCDPTRGMLIVVRDPGTGFDPASVPSPVLGENVFSDHGRGIFLINRLVDEVRYEGGGTEIHMRVKRSDA